MSEPNESNTAPRDAGLSRLYRSAADEVPPAVLDAAILQAARDAVAPQAAPVLPWWKRLLVPAGVAATALFAVMLTLTLARHSSDSVEVSSQKAESAPAAAAPLSPAPPAVSKGRADQAAAAKEAAPAPTSSPLAPVEKKMKAAPPVRDAAIPQAVPAAPILAPAPAPASSVGRLAEPAATTESRSSSDGLAAAAAAPARESAAKRAAPPTEIAWLDEIRQLRRQGRHEEAARRLAEFRRAYPDYPLPEDLK